MHPFTVNTENKAMVLDNISYLLNSFLKNTNFEYVLFVWVIHQPEIAQDILQRLETADFKLISITLTATPEKLRANIQQDVAAGKRELAAIEPSIARLPLYDQQATIKLDTTELTVPAAVTKMIQIINKASDLN